MNFSETFGKKVLKKRKSLSYEISCGFTNLQKIGNQRREWEIYSALRLDYIAYGILHFQEKFEK